jgi:hypothetical protein
MKNITRNRAGCRVIKIKLWLAIPIFILISLGIVWLVSQAVDFTETLTTNRIHSGIVDGIKSKQGKFWLNDNISIKPTGADKGEISIAGAGDEGGRKVWEGQ